MYKGELISLLVTLLWTVTAMAAEVASKRLSPLGLNVIRMLLSLILLGALMWVVCGQPLPQDADADLISVYLAPDSGSRSQAL